MNQIIDRAIFFAVGATVGVMVAYLILKKKYDIQEEEDRKFYKEMRDEYKQKLDDISGKNKEAQKALEESEGRLQEARERVNELEEADAQRIDDIKCQAFSTAHANTVFTYKNIDKSQKTDYARIASAYGHNFEDAADIAEAKHIEEMLVEEQSSAESKFAQKLAAERAEKEAEAQRNFEMYRDLGETEEHRNPKPVQAPINYAKYDGKNVYRVDYEEYMMKPNNQGWEDKTVVWYPDDNTVLYDDDHTKMDNYPMILGYLEEKDFEDGPVYVRNMYENSDFEIIEGTGPSDMWWSYEGTPDSGDMPW